MSIAPDLTITITDITRTSLCVTPNDGQRVFHEIAKALNSDRRVRVSFKDVARLTTAFLNPALGQLYGVFGEKIVRERVEFADVTSADSEVIQKTIVNAIRFFKNPDAVKAARAEILGAEDGTL